MKTELITSLDGFKALEAAWNKLLPADTDIDLPLTWIWFDAWLRGFWSSIIREDPQARLHILAIWDEQGIVAIAPMAIHARRYHGIKIRMTQCSGKRLNALLGSCTENRPRRIHR